jgi:hypothetical protein
VEAFGSYSAETLARKSNGNLAEGIKRLRLACSFCISAAVFIAAGSSSAFAQSTVPREKAAHGQPTADPTDSLSPACRAAKQYIDLAREQRFAEIGDLFSDKVDYVGTDGVGHTNREDISKAYIALGENAKKSGKPLRPRLERLSPLHDNECFMEFDNFDYAEGAYRLFAVDHFIVGPDGKVVWFRPFFQENMAQWFAHPGK